MFRISRPYLIITILLFITEVLIALYVHDKIVRPYAGDYLVVILIYCFLRAFLRISVLTAALSALLFSYAVEFLQYFNIVEFLGLQRSELARTVIGSSFGYGDILLYTAGILTVICIEKYVFQKNIRSRV